VQGTEYPIGAPGHVLEIYAGLEKGSYILTGRCGMYKAMFVGLALVLAAAASAVALECRELSMRDDVGMEPLYDCYMQYYYYIRYNPPPAVRGSGISRAGPPVTSSASSSRWATFP
jgi:hypothetical protein